MTEPQPDSEWRERLRSQGYRLTPQREFVLAAVNDLGHATPDQILERVRQRSSAVNISTVYRTLELLEELGLVRHTHITDRAPTYHSKVGPEHVHLVCRGCDAVIDADLSDFDGLTRTLRDRHGFEADVGHLTVFGRCRSCNS